jgi:serine/threonine protein kinase
MLQNTIREGRPILVKAIDFGCSQRIHDNVPLQIRMGTPIFFAPEVFQKWYGVESDCWSVGIMVESLSVYI